MDHVLVTRSAVDDWRRKADYPKGRIGVFFGVRTAICFCDGVDPREFDFYPIPQIANGFLLFERGPVARKKFRELGPMWEVIF